ncbi:hypothetical protein C5B42_04345 [Candidatus Cerribacteria bacterium 'Amazon FNV 2010 28 9']|uniref:HTH arsR-type domain-containing protein n=1 Tax=Candidatus Cerribacteria bacterium 'Amazon FNV 2010 28 9' TaxID=2081795 RepID=A0A317JS56_9BACT|nr:MAG: hypothetical protein C5B42_04345 [Candidatus Cerribacteria bacterium 'Amazon FNV 2010 28 9']
MYEMLFNIHAKLLKALAHPRRLEIVQLLRDQELCVSDIYAMLDLPQANISQHLMILRDAGVLRTKRKGKQIMYTLVSKKVTRASDLLREVLVDQYQGTDVARQFNVKMNELVPVVHDPVCQMRVSPKTAGSKLQYKEHDYYFCASGCLKKFKENPQKYLQ